MTLDVAEGETLALIGRSGSGKTTALRLVNALLLPTAAHVRVAGRATTEWDPIRLRRRTGYVIQEVGLFPHLTVADNVGMVPELEGWDAARRARASTSCWRWSACRPRSTAGRYPHQLSGGQRQRVGVARALAADPPLLLLDEPFGALDPMTRRELQDEFRALQQPLGKTAIFVTHDLARRRASPIAWRCWPTARLLAAGTLEELESSADSGGARVPRRGAGLMIAEILHRDGAHLLLVSVSVGLATLVGVPLGILLTRRPHGSARSWAPRTSCRRSRAWRCSASSSRSR